MLYRVENLVITNSENNVIPNSENHMPPKKNMTLCKIPFYANFTFELIVTIIYAFDPNVIHIDTNVIIAVNLSCMQN